MDSEGTQDDNGQRPRCVPLCAAAMAARTILYRFYKWEDMLVEYCEYLNDAVLACLNSLSCLAVV